MKFFPKILLFFGLSIQIESSECPNGSQQIPNESVCLFPVTDPKFYYDVIRQCEAFGGIPVKITNAYENSFVFSMTSDLNGVDPYIGVERKPNNQWNYSDGSPLIYQNWDNDEPKMDNSSMCATMTVGSGKWRSAECSYVRPSICSILGGDVSQCPQDWLYFENTSSCYYLQNFTYPDGQKWQLYNVTTAEKNCQQMGAHLVSIHSKDEDDFVYDVVKSNVGPSSTLCSNQWAWIGYYGNGAVGQGNWTDRSPVNYSGYHSINGFYYWAITNDASCGCQQWNWFSIAYNHARFVCKKPLKKL